jgi:hypothetical protein
VSQVEVVVFHFHLLVHNLPYLPFFQQFVRLKVLPEDHGLLLKNDQAFLGSFKDVVVGIEPVGEVIAHGLAPLLEFVQEFLCFALEAVKAFLELEHVLVCFEYCLD